MLAVTSNVVCLRLGKNMVILIFIDYRYEDGRKVGDLRCDNGGI